MIKLLHGVNECHMKWKDPKSYSYYGSSRSKLSLYIKNMIDLCISNIPDSKSNFILYQIFESCVKIFQCDKICFLESLQLPIRYYIRLKINVLLNLDLKPSVMD